MRALVTSRLAEVQAALGRPDSSVDELLRRLPGKGGIIHRDR